MNHLILLGNSRCCSWALFALCYMVHTPAGSPLEIRTGQQLVWLKIKRVQMWKMIFPNDKGCPLSLSFEWHDCLLFLLVVQCWCLHVHGAFRGECMPRHYDHLFCHLSKLACIFFSQHLLQIANWLDLLPFGSHVFTVLCFFFLSSDHTGTLCVNSGKKFCPTPLALTLQ